MPELGRRFIVALSGGVALGAYQGGALARLCETGPAPDGFAGASVGGLNAAIAAGTPRERTGEALRAFWTSASDVLLGGLLSPAAEPEAPDPFGEGRRATSALASLMFGRPGMFRPQISSLHWARPQPGLYSLEPLRPRLESLVDFDRLNSGETQLVITASDVVTGEQVVFDTRRGDRIGPDHLMASCAMLPIFAPIEIEGRLLGDGGLTGNMPLAPFLEDGMREPLLAVAMDLMPLRGSRPRTMVEAAARAADIAFASKTWSLIAAARREHELMTRVAALQRAQGEEASPPGAAAIVLLEYPLGPSEPGLAKLFDYSATTLERRWSAGARGMEAALAAAMSLAQTNGFVATRCDAEPRRERASA
ncbi:patatin-like phospholipase family protein [Alsobacter sp. SYSU BS001988]